MPKIKLQTYTLKEYEAGKRYTISCGLGTITPQKTVEIRTVADCEAALLAFAEELKATNKPWMVSILFDKHSGRKPAGFDAAEKATRLRAFVNTELAQD